MGALVCHPGSEQSFETVTICYNQQVLQHQLKEFFETDVLLDAFPSLRMTTS